MDNLTAAAPLKWKFQGTNGLTTASSISIRGILNMLMENIDKDDTRVVVPMGHGDPSVFPSFRTTPTAEDGVVDALRSAKFNGYSPTVGILPARRAVAEYLSRDLPYVLSPDDVFITLGCIQAIEIILSVLARPGANILLPRPGFPFYEARAAHCNLEVRYFDLLPDKGWEVDIKAVEELADENTVAMVIINPGNPCGNVFSYHHLKLISETARKIGIMVIADEVYYHLTFGNTPFTPMGVFGSVVPVLTVGSISKRWIVPGWRLGWLVTNDPEGIFKQTGIVESIKGYLNISSDPPTFIQGGVAHILRRTTEGFYSRIISLLKEVADICNETLKDIPCINCVNKPEGSMFVMVKLDLSMLDGIKDDMDFCLRLAKEESVIVMPGVALGLKNWLRITFAMEPSCLKEGLERMKAFCKRNGKC